MIIPEPMKSSVRGDKGYMRIIYLFLLTALLAIALTASAQGQLSSANESLQDKITAEGEQLRDRSVKQLLEGNLTRDRISQEINTTKENLTNLAREKIGETIDENLNQTADQIEQTAREELHKRLGQEIPQQPGFGAAMAALVSFVAAGLLRRRG
jgi:hypothetical protein